MNLQITILIYFLLAGILGCSLPLDQTTGNSSLRPLVISKQGYFFVAGKYVDRPNGRIMAGQMYVQFQIPQQLKHPYPIIMIHGGGQTGTNFLGTPDGRPGWADFFLSEGYAVYVVDQPGRGRSVYHAEIYGPTNQRATVQAAEERFTSFERFKQWPQAALHTQWPGSGVAGDPAFDQFFASQQPSLDDRKIGHSLNQDAGAALLDKIGPAILLAHSQAGAFAWLIADIRPQLIKGIVAVEPNGPPFRSDMRWGPADALITYDPPVTDFSQLKVIREAKPSGPNLERCSLQAEPARQLPNLKSIPILIVSGEASYHAPYEHCISKFLTQAGVANTFIQLADEGIRGNGHMMMLEKNNLEIAALIARWLNQSTK
jgi:pimeloyl-ACP methyl ester carboxylesterase